MITLTMAYWVVIAMDRFLFRRDKLFWQELVGSMMLKGTVLVLMGFNYPIGTWTVASLAVVIPALIGGWFLVRKRVAEIHGTG